MAGNIVSSAERSIATADSSWTPQAIDVLAQACEYYGGMKTWRALRKIRLIPGRLSGLIPWLKGVNKTFPLPSAFDIFPHQRSTRFIHFPNAEHVGIFQQGAVRIERIDSAEVIVQSERHRQSFAGLAGVRRWQPLDALYFFGYALAHYHALPFSLWEGRLLGVRAGGAANVTILDIELPADLHTHCRRQQFHFDDQGQLLRHDYNAEIVGVWARGAHYWNRQTRFNGFPVALERQVVARALGLTVPINALRATFANAELEFDEA